MAWQEHYSLAISNKIKKKPNGKWKSEMGIVMRGYTFHPLKKFFRFYRSISVCIDASVDALMN